MKRIIYLGYHLKNLNLALFKKFLNFAAKKTGKSKLRLTVDAIVSVLRYKVSILEYFQFRFYDLTHEERKKWAGTGYMYEYQRLMNPIAERDILSDKVAFSKAYHPFVHRKVLDINELNRSPDTIHQMLSNTSGKLVFKAKKGNCGKQVEVKATGDLTERTFLTYMNDHGYDMVEDFIVQHPLLTELSPNSVNTVRIFTNLTKDNEVNILGCRLRLGIHEYVDNMASGGITVPVDEKTGVIIGKGVYSDITKDATTIHPISGRELMGFQIPFWQETIAMVKAAALLHIQNRSVGWDVAIMKDGPELIEGNHDWCKLVLQLPIHQGMKEELDQYIFN